MRNERDFLTLRRCSPYQRQLVPGWRQRLVRQSSQCFVEQRPGQFVVGAGWAVGPCQAEVVGRFPSVPIAEARLGTSAIAKASLGTSADQVAWAVGAAEAWKLSLLPSCCIRSAPSFR